MSIVPLFGHQSLRRRLSECVAREALPSSLLLHGSRGIGKQRLALWLGQTLLCTGADDRPCGTCASCGYSSQLAHPDIYWFFPRPRLAGANPAIEDVLDDYAEAIAERRASGGLYAASSGTDGIFISSVRALVQAAAYTPKLGRRKVFVVGDAERMVSQEGADQAANAFLKLLEEPPADTTLVLTSSEPGALLPTIRSRLVALRAAPLPAGDVRAFLDHPTVKATLDKAGIASRLDDRLALAAGAPGALLGGTAANEAMDAARALLASSTAGRVDQIGAAFGLGGSKARGRFSEVLDALTVLLHARARAAVARADGREAVSASRAVEVVEHAKLRASGNVNPQLIGAALARQLSELFK